ncbi:uncharacterized protein P884DRAFT_120980 [Thermothelomyces heterothallicus CBS 202.75]|uniref:uncharacterized protein n=1 Tax=Thermothelomyces heterothallicus CBS 202.75 TaxID=1149848 RepID=UPI003743C7F7
MWASLLPFRTDDTNSRDPARGSSQRRSSTAVDHADPPTLSDYLSRYYYSTSVVALLLIASAG